VTTSGYKYRKLVCRLLFCEGPAESAKMWWIYVIRHPNDMYSGGSETEISQRSWIQKIIHRNGILAANIDCMQCL